jgi:hypothetical protein
MGEVVLLRDYHLKRMERDAAEVLGRVLPLTEFAKQGGPVVQGSEPCEVPSYMDGKEPA